MKIHNNEILAQLLKIAACTNPSTDVYDSDVKGLFLDTITESDDSASLRGLMQLHYLERIAEALESIARKV